MTVDEALELGDRICDFLLSCGGCYQHLTGEMQANVAHALGSEQYVLKEQDGEIIYFASFWRVSPFDIEDIKARIRPAELTRGSVAYVSETGNKGGRKDLAEMIGRIRERAGAVQGVIWHRPAKADKFYNFPSQRGKEASHGR